MVYVCIYLDLTYRSSTFLEKKKNAPPCQKIHKVGVLIESQASALIDQTSKYETKRTQTMWKYGLTNSQVK